jgi:hypothetical protein
MPICVGKCPVPWPNIMNNQHCLVQPEIPDDIIRLRCDPFVRLTCIPTKSFSAKKCTNPCAPKDHLDIALSACYDHHRQWWAPKAQTVMQCATYRLFPWGRYVKLDDHITWIICELLCQPINICHVFHYRAQERVCRLKCLPDDPCLLACVASTQQQTMVNHEPYRNDVSHMNCSIASPHISNTNRGYGRSIDGLFYNS